MLHPSYTDLMAVVNSDVEQGEEPIVRSRYSIVLATAKRARQIIAGQQPLVKTKGQGIKPLSIAVEELHNGKIRVLTEEEAGEEQNVQEEVEEVIESSRDREEVENIAEQDSEEISESTEE